MSKTQQPKPTSLLSPRFINGVYIPSGLLILGVGITKSEWLPAAVGVSLLLGVWKIYSFGRCCLCLQTLVVRGACLYQFITVPELAPVPIEIMATNALKPDVFQEFSLKEKTVLSHNVAV